ncbi:MAG TPA: glutaminase, partial [Flavobacterium sp.]
MNQIEQIIKNLHTTYKSCVEGDPATYIPELAKANRDHFSIVITTVDGKVYKIGDSEIEFSMQSTS